MSGSSSAATTSGRLRLGGKVGQGGLLCNDTHILDIGPAAGPTVPRMGFSLRGALARYLISVSILNIGRYMLMMITPTIRPTQIIINGSMIEVSDWIAASTSSS